VPVVLFTATLFAFVAVVELVAEPTDKDDIV
jgi:hypothetical protein